MTEALTSEQVRRWGKYAETSPLYRRLIEIIASDDDLMRVLNRVENLPRPNVLFAGVQFIMLREGGAELSAYYPNFTDSPKPADDIAAPFRTFVLGHEEELAEIGRTRFTQTNECRRCVALLPAIWATGLDCFHLVDFGCSAGLNLHLDRYHYRWGEVTWGPESAVNLHTENRGQPVEPMGIEVLTRTGLDLHPIDPSDTDDRRWLEALVWPEHNDRRERLRAALDLANDYPVERIAGDALETLGPAIDRLDDGEPVVVISSFILNQFTPDQRDRFDSLLDERRRSRPVFRVSMEWIDPEDHAAALTVVGESGPTVIGHAQPHGEWVEFYARP